MSVLHFGAVSTFDGNNLGLRLVPPLKEKRGWRIVNSGCNDSMPPTSVHVSFRLEPVPHYDLDPDSSQYSGQIFLISSKKNLVLR